MAKLTFDFSGIGGLVERHHGDLNDTTAQPHLRYIGNPDQFADGYYNPIKKYGYMAPANNSYTTLTGSVAAGINSIQYDPSGDVVYFSEAGENILKLDGMDDTSLANHLSITSGYDLKDMVVYEVGGKKALAYIIDTNENPIYGGTIAESLGSYVGFCSLDSTDGATMLQKDVITTLNTGGSVQQGDYYIVDATSEDITQRKFRKISFEVSGSDLNTSTSSSLGNTISGVELKMRRSAGTGAGITIKVSLQSDASASVAPYTSRGAWVTATAYSVNDTVTQSGQTYQCWSAHTSGASDQPGIGGGWEDKWSIFGAPSGTELASGTFLLSAIDDDASGGNFAYRVEFSSRYELSDSTQYWIVIEESGANMTASDSLAILGTVNSTGVYAGNEVKGWFDEATDYWRSVDINGGYGVDSIDFRLILNRDDDWTLNTVFGRFVEKTGENMYLYVADNNLLYWIVGNRIHAIDGSSTGGGFGTAYENVLSFPSYTTIPDVTETRSRMYIAVQTSNITSTTDPRTFTSEVAGVYVWDRRSQILGSSDFYPCSGAKEIKTLAKASDGSIMAITVGNSGFSEIRKISGNQFTVLHTFEKDGYPKTRRSVGQLNNLTVWLGANGVWYLYGSVAPGNPEALYKIGTMAGQANAGLAPGAILIGNEYASAPQSAILFGWTDSDPSYVVQKWYPNGEGTLNSVSQLANQGDVYTILRYLPELSIVRGLTIYCAPTSSSGSTVIATIKVYYNQSSTASVTKQITQAEASRGYVTLDLNKANVNAVQFEIERNTTDALGGNDFLPSVGVLEYTNTTTHTPSSV